MRGADALLAFNEEGTLRTLTKPAESLFPTNFCNAMEFSDLFASVDGIMARMDPEGEPS